MKTKKTTIFPKSKLPSWEKEPISYWWEKKPVPYWWEKKATDEECHIVGPASPPKRKKRKKKKMALPKPLIRIAKEPPKPKRMIRL